MTVKEFMKRVKAQMSPEAWKKLRDFAKTGVIKWGNNSQQTGPDDNSGG